MREDSVQGVHGLPNRSVSASLSEVYLYQVSPCHRAPLEESRKWGSYYIANLLLKTYFKLNSASLSKNILNSLRVGGRDMPDFSVFPKSQQVTFKYHEGVLAFLEENYVHVRSQFPNNSARC
jgi:hypothetical protein